MAEWSYFSCSYCNASLGEGLSSLTNLGVTHVICNNCKEVNATDNKPFSQMDKSEKKEFWLTSVYLNNWALFIICIVALLGYIGISNINDGDIVGGVIPLMVSIAMPILFVILRKKMIRDIIEKIEKLQKETEILIDSIS